MTLRVDKTRCIGCGMCAAAVPEVFRVVDHVSTVLALPKPERMLTQRGLFPAGSSRRLCNVS